MFQCSISAGEESELQIKMRADRMKAQTAGSTGKKFLFVNRDIHPNHLPGNKKIKAAVGNRRFRSNFADPTY
jgi:hypothetical protein